MKRGPMLLCRIYLKLEGGVESDR